MNQYEDLFNILPYGVLRYNSSGRMLEANPTALKILGINRKELVRRQVADQSWQFTDEMNRPLNVEELPLSRSMRTGKAIRNVTLSVYSPKNHRHVWLRCQAIPHISPSSTSSEYWIIFHDVTDEFQAEASLRESQHNLDLAQRVASIGSAVFNLATRRWSFSQELVRIFGVASSAPPADLEALAPLVCVEDREPYLQGLEVATRGVVPFPLEFTITLPDGRRRIIYREIELIKESKKAWRGIIFVHHDITARRDAETQREILQDQLYHAQRLDALGTLASGIAHDLNNTLVPILGLSQALAQLPEMSPSARDLLNVIESAGIRARDLVQQVLAFSRKANHREIEFSLAEVFRGTMKLARATVPSTITMLNDINDVGALRGDPTQMHQLLLNLISNSSFAIGKKLGWISVSVREIEEKQSQYIELEVADNGVGMDEEVQKKMFEPFFTTKAVGVGTGLGLSVVHGIVRAHSGSINVESAAGAGTTFVVRLPKVKVILANGSEDESYLSH